MLLKFSILSSLEIFFAFFKKHKIFLVNNLKKQHLFYITLPNAVCLTKINSFITLFAEKKEKRVQNFFFFFQKWFYFLQKPLRKKLVLKGLGLKAIKNKLDNCLELKLGFSHLIRCDIPDTLSVKVLKNVIVVESFCATTLGLFLHKIHSLKAPNIYKGKGIWFQNEKIKLKTIKKT